MNTSKELIINKKILDEVISHCKEEFPYEACGILAGKDNIVSKIYKTKNIDKTSFSYYIDPEEQFNIMKEIKNNNLRMLCIYHSHPYSAPYPSTKDIKLAFYDDVFYMIVGIQSLYNKGLTSLNSLIKVFTIKEGNINEIEFETIDNEKL